ncbi:MAG: beta-ketoacyl synthase N-terminal-like domain-containing protein [Phycisphaerales bacterium]
MPSAIRNPQSAIPITGLGLLTPLGHSPYQTWQALCAGRRITDRCANLPGAGDIDPVTLVQSIGHIAVARHTCDDPAVELAERAARQAITEAGIGDDQPLPMVMACSKGAMHAAALSPLPCRERVRVDRSITDNPTFLPAPLGPVSYVVERLRKRLHIGPVRQVVAACASSLIGLHLARQWLLHENVNRVLVVTTEAALVPMFIHSYRRLGVLPKLTVDDYRGHPLDERRHGFVLTEVAAAMLLELSPKRRPLAYLADTAVASEADDIMRLSPDRPALRHVAERLFAGHTSGGIDLLHPHATGTPDNDASELAAYADELAVCRLPFAVEDQAMHNHPNRKPQTASRKLFPDVYACKGALGHGLGSAGLTAAVLAVLCAKTQTRPPMPWLTQPIQTPLRLAVEPDGRAIRRQALFAAGFGGHVAGAIIQAP